MSTGRLRRVSNLPERLDQLALRIEQPPLDHRIARAHPQNAEQTARR